MPTLEEIASTLEFSDETTPPHISKDKFQKLKKNIKEEHGLEWEDVKKWKYVGGFKHPDREHGEPCKRSQRLENLFRGYYQDTGAKWLAYFKTVEARTECYCQTNIYWQYIIVKDYDTLNVMPNIYHSKKRPRKYLLVGSECVKRFIDTSKKCVKCKAIHKNHVPECNDCRTDGKWEIFCCHYCKKRGKEKLPLYDTEGGILKKRKCSECHEKWLKYCEYCKVETDTVCKINKKNGKRRCGDCYNRHLNYALKKSMETNYGYSHQSYQ